MNRWFFYSLLALCGVACVPLLVSADTSPILQSYTGQELQAQVWREQSRLRIFWAMQLLCGSMLAWVFGYAAMWGGRPYSPLIWLVGVLGLLCYYRVDPRYQASELPVLLRGVLMFGIGGAIEFAFFRASAEKESRSFLRDSLLLGVFFVLGALSLRFITHVPAPELTAVSLRSASTLLYLYLAGFLSMACLFGSARGFFAVIPFTPLSKEERRSTVLQLFSTVVICVLICGGLLLGANASRLYWALLAPIVPPAMAIYAPITWFSTEGATEVFSSVFGDSGGEAARARLYLGIAFQYFSLFVGLTVYAALRKPSRLQYVMAHIAIVLYFFPSFWLAKMIAAW